MKRFIVAVDFDGTIVTHEFPDIGTPVPGAIEWLKKFQEAGADLILWTMRSDGQKYGPVLTQAIQYCETQGIKFFGINHNPEQDSWTKSPKAYANLYIDDSAIGCPLTRPGLKSEKLRPFVNWFSVGPRVLSRIRKELK